MITAKPKKPKLAQAQIAGLSKAARTNGGVTAPPGTSGGKTQGLGGNTSHDPNHPSYVPQPAGGNAGSTSSGGSTAPSPSPAPSTGPPETPGSITGRAGTEALHTSALKDDAYKKYLAALAYGDPAQINYWGKIAADQGATGITNVDPAAGNLGSLLQIEQEDKANRLANTYSHTGNNTFRSGFMLNDVKDIGNATSAAQAKAAGELHSALVELEEAENEANNTYAQEIGGWNEKEREAALENEPGGEGGGGGDENEPPETQQQSTGLKKTYPSISKNKKHKISMGKKAK